MLQPKIGVGRKIAGRVVGREFHAILLAVLIVEWRKDYRRAELAFVGQILGKLVIAVDAQRESFHDFLARASIEIVRPFRFRRVVEGGIDVPVVLRNFRREPEAMFSNGGGER